MKMMTRTARPALIAFLGAAGAFLPSVATGADFTTSCNETADREFNDGLTLLHNMMYIQAEAAFGAAAAADPDCAMAEWGVAMSNFHPLWPGTPTAAETERGMAAAEKLATLKPGTPLEAALIAAVEAFYSPQHDGYTARLSAWGNAQMDAAADHPDDIDAAALGALAGIALAPRGPGRLDVLADIGTTLDALHQIDPSHPGVIHYAIHAFDNPPLKARGTPYAELYDKTAPTAPHALHMPSHIFTRTGDWEATIDLNRRSAEAALAQSTDVVQTHYVHAIDYMVYGHLQQGERDEAQRLVDEMLAIENHQASFGGAYALAASPVRLLLESEDWEAAARMSTDLHDAIPWENFPQTVAMVWFAKGLGAARAGHIDDAKAAVEELAQLRGAMKERQQGYWEQLSEAQILTIEAWIELAQGNEDLALTHQAAAADLEDQIGKSPVTPGHVLPARELLGDMLMKLGRTDEALTAYRATLAHSPNRARSLTAIE